MLDGLKAAFFDPHHGKTLPRDRRAYCSVTRSSFFNTLLRFPDASVGASKLVVLRLGDVSLSTARMKGYPLILLLRSTMNNFLHHCGGKPRVFPVARQFRNHYTLLSAVLRSNHTTSSWGTITFIERSRGITFDVVREIRLACQHVLVAICDSESLVLLSMLSLEDSRCRSGVPTANSSFMIAERTKRRFCR